MPRPRSTAKGFPVDPETCRAVRHLAGPEFKVYDMMKAFSVAGRTSREGRDSKSSLLFTAAIDPSLCNALALSRNQTYLMRDRLEKLGWIIKRAEGERRSDGKKSPDTWEVVSHSDFIKTNQNTCPNNPCPVDPEEREERRNREASAEDQERLSRLVGRHNSPASLALASAIANLTDEDWQAVRLDWEVTEEEWKRLKPKSPVPTDRDRQTTPYTQAPAPVPMKQSDQSLSNGVTSPCETDEPVPMRREESVKASANTTHTPTPPKPDGRVGGVLTEKHDDGEEEVKLLLAGFVKHNGGEAGQVTSKQKEQLKELAQRHGREKFRAAARAWLKASPWNDRTTHPFTGFISGFDGYAFTSVHAANEDARRKKNEEDAARSSEWNRRKFTVFFDLTTEFLASLPQEDRDYIAKVGEAKCLEELPRDNGRNYVVEQFEFRKKRQLEEAATSKAFADEF